MKTTLLIASVALSLAGCTGDAARFATSPDGIIVAPKQGGAKRVRLQLMSDRIVRVTAVPAESFDQPKSLMVNATPARGVKFTATEKNGVVTLKTAALTAEVTIETGAVRFLDTAGKQVLGEAARSRFEPSEAADYYQVRQRFTPGADDAFYGLGQHQNAQMNYRGEDVLLSQHNMDVAVPFVVSSANYGVLWDNNSITRFGDPKPYGLLSRDLKVFDADGKPGGLTASYFVDGKLKLKRVEPDIDYQYIKDLAKRPAEMLGTNVSNTSAQKVDIAKESVVWEGSIESDVTGDHKFQLYSSSYFKLFVDGNKVLDGWRQNWNAWYHNFKVPMQPGKKLALRIEWIPNDGQIALLHNNPLPKDVQDALTFSSEAGKSVDYYFVSGKNLDEVIAGYRALTGKAVLLPKWVYGFWQSRQRYNTQDELVEVVKEYRKRKIPIDNIVQDWFYWREDDWGSHGFDPKRFPDPKKMVDQLHALNAHVMISVWPKFYPQTDNYKELDAKGFMYHGNIEAGAHDWVGQGYASSFYDPYSQEARDIYWRQIKDNLNVHGFDAWWLDASEPDVHSNLDIASIKQRIGPTQLGPAAAFFNSYSLEHTRGVYDGERATDKDTRAFILTRSGFAGVQRNAAAVWSGDVASRWDDLYNQISAGVNFSLSGIPNWSFDIGGFALEERYQKPDAKSLDEWRELNLRWFQYGAFVPLFRSHGEAPFREIYNLAPVGSEVYSSMVWYDELRYRLMPYLYSLAADTYHRDGTIMRGLVMDFANDVRARNVKDQYLFGPALLVNPVYEYKARSRKVYLPKGAYWIDFYTGTRFDGGAEIDAPAPLARMPLFVRAGSIVPMGAVIQHTNEGADAPITLYVYTGADGSFDLYEDDGLSYGYERGEFARISISYDEAKRALTVGARQGGYPNMNAKRQIHVRWNAPVDDRSSLNPRNDMTIDYTGEAVTVTRVVP